MADHAEGLEILEVMRAVGRAVLGAILICGRGRDGVHRVVSGPLLAYELSTCRPGAACRCVAIVHGLGDSAMTWDKTMLASAAESQDGLRWIGAWACSASCSSTQRSLLAAGPVGAALVFRHLRELLVGAADLAPGLRLGMLLDDRLLN